MKIKIVVENVKYAIILKRSVVYNYCASLVCIYSHQELGYRNDPYRGKLLNSPS